MAAIDFPSIRSPHPEMFDQRLVNPQHRTPAEAGRRITRPKFTKGRWVFTLGWDAMPDADYDALCDFFDTYAGALFNWSHFKTGVVYECIFLQDELPKAKPYVGHWGLRGLEIGER